MSFSPEQVAALSAMLSPDRVKDREQAGRKVYYIEGWHAIAEANRIFGFDGWARETVYCHEVCRYERPIGRANTPGWKVGYEAKVRVTIGETVREGTGHGSGIATDLFDAVESAAKEAETDAMKRALMTFGNPFGLALYDKSRENVGYEQAEESRPVKAPPPSSENPFDEHSRPAVNSDAIDTSAADLAWLTMALDKVADADQFELLMKHKNWKGRYALLPNSAKDHIDQKRATKRYQLGIGDKPDAEAKRLVNLVAAG